MLGLIQLVHAEDLYVSSNERGASILLNGVATGYRTPATVPGVKPGETLVTVEGACSRGEAVVDVLPGLTTRASIVANEQMGSLTVVPVPLGARLELDNAPYQGAPGIPLAVACGDHTVRAALEGYVTAVLTIEVEMGQDLTVPINMVKLGLGSLDLSVQPRNATMYFDGRAVGTDAVTLPSVYQGVHTISAELDGYQSAKKQVVIEDGSALAFHFELARRSQKKESTVTPLGGEPEVASTRGTSTSAAVSVEDDSDADERKAQAAREKAAEAAEAAKAAEAAEAAKAEEEAAREAEERKRLAAARREAARREAEEREARQREAEERAPVSRPAPRDDADDDDGDAVVTNDDDDARPARPTRATSQAEIPREGKGAGKTIGGVALLVAGAGAGAYSLYALDQTSQAYTAYNAKLDGAEDDRRQQELADDFYDDNVVPRQTVLYGSAIGAGLFLAGGVVVLVVDERLPSFVPAPGGGMLLWNGRF